MVSHARVRDKERDVGSLRRHGRVQCLASNGDGRRLVNRSVAQRAPNRLRAQVTASDTRMSERTCATLRAQSPPPAQVLHGSRRHKRRVQFPNTTDAPAQLMDFDAAVCVPRRPPPRGRFCPLFRAFSCQCFIAWACRQTACLFDRPTVGPPATSSWSRASATARPRPRRSWRSK